MQTDALPTHWFISHVHPGVVQVVPQSSFPPGQPLPITPQYWPPENVHETFVQFGLPQMPGTFAPQAVPAGQLVPQDAAPPQPSPIVPQ